MQTFVESVKKSVEKRAGWERHRAFPVKKLIPKDRYSEMEGYLKTYLQLDSRCQIDHVEGVGTVMQLPTHRPKKVMFDIRKKAEELGVLNILHTEAQENERQLYACLEEL